VRDALFTIRARTSLHGAARLGLVVSRRAAPRAVQRNRIKRYIRESFRHHKPLLRGLDVVVLANAKAADTDSATQRTTLERLWRIVAEKCKSTSSV
jgi:ribonuclease P protein component